MRSVQLLDRRHQLGDRHLPVHLADAVVEVPRLAETNALDERINPGADLIAFRNEVANVRIRGDSDPIYALG